MSVKKTLHTEIICVFWWQGTMATTTMRDKWRIFFSYVSFRTVNVCVRFGQNPCQLTAHKLKSDVWREIVSLITVHSHVQRLPYNCFNTHHHSPPNSPSIQKPRIDVFSVSQNFELLNKLYEFSIFLFSLRNIQ